MGSAVVALRQAKEGFLLPDKIERGKDAATSAARNIRAAGKEDPLPWKHIVKEATC